MDFLKTVLVVCIVSTSGFFMPSKAMKHCDTETLLGKFFYAIKKNDIGILKLYLKEDPTLINTMYVDNVKGKKYGHGCFPLHCALAEGHYETTKFLLKKGALVNSKNLEGDTPLLYAIKHMNIDANKFSFMPVDDPDMDAKIIQLLMDYGADYDFIDKEGNSPLLNIFKKSTPLLNRSDYEVKKNVLKLLLEKKVDTNIQGKCGKTVLHHVAETNNIYFKENKPSFRLPINDEIAQMFLKAGANPNVQNSSGITALFLAISNKRFEMAKAYMEYGGDKDIKCPDASGYYISSTELAFRRDLAFAKYLCFYELNNFKGFKNNKDFDLKYSNFYKINLKN